MIHTWRVTVPELTGEETRGVYLYLPEEYSWQTERHYPVLYMFDGHNVFFDSDATYGKSWGLGEYLDKHEVPLIVAAVECNHHPDNGRLSEYSPFNFYEPELGQVTGRGRLTMDWFVRTFKPGIDRAYRTLSDRKHTFIAGSSMGGLMSLYALLEYNHIFSRAAALSPSLWVAPMKVESMIRNARVAPDTVLYMDYGAKELDNHSGIIRGLGRAAALLTEKRLLLDFRIVPDGEHCEASWERQIPFFMSTLFYGRE